ncbi:MAG: TylF/MycF/NovP-related O-methyltransferase [Verrucomicrobiota bacterium]
MAGANHFSRNIKAALFAWLGRYLTWMFSSPLTLDLKRCAKKDVLRAVQVARDNHRGAAIYVFSEAAYGEIRGARHISTIEALTSATLPCAVILACDSDELAMQAVQFIRNRAGMFYYGAARSFPAARYFHRDEAARLALKAAHGASLAMFDLPDFENIAQAIHATRSLAGDYVEIGVYKGSSAYFALDYMERAGIRRRSYFLDTFTGFDSGSAAASVDRTWFNTHTDTSREAVQKLLAHFSPPHEVIKSNIITDALPAMIEKIAVCNIDVDMYEAVAAALVKVAPRMAVGGIIIAEDSGHTPLLIGAYAAGSDFLESPAGSAFVPVEMMSGQLFLIKVRDSKT